MKRVIDGAIPACAAVGTLPIALRLVPVPPSLTPFLGFWAAWAWCLTMTISLSSIVVGVAISKRHPRRAFGFEAVPLSYVGIIFLIHVVALFARNGLDAWATGWWEIGFIVYFFGRAFEVWRALQIAKRDPVVSNDGARDVT